MPSLSEVEKACSPGELEAVYGGGERLGGDDDTKHRGHVGVQRINSVHSRSPGSVRAPCGHHLGGWGSLSP